MELTQILTIIGMIIINAGAIIAAWIKMKTDITAINVRLTDIDSRVSQQEIQNSKKIDVIEQRLEKFYDTNDTQHDAISTKIDNIKDSITDLKVAVVSNGAHLDRQDKNKNN